MLLVMSASAIPFDQFSSVFGSRRGSRAAQARRDEQEAVALSQMGSPEDCEGIGAALMKASCLSMEVLRPLFPFFSSTNPEVVHALDEGLTFRGLCNGINLTAPLLALPCSELPRPVRQRLLALTVTYLRGQSSVGADERWLRGAALSLLTVFEQGTLSHIEDYHELAQAVAEQLNEQEDTGGTPQCYMSMAITLGRQPNGHLDLCKPLFSALEDGLALGTTTFSYREDQMQGLERGLRESEHDSSERKAAFAGVRQKLAELRAVTPPPAPVKLHPLRRLLFRR